MRINTKIRSLLLSTALALVLAACASTPSSPEMTLEERAQARWDHILNDEAELAYPYLTPGYRDITSLGDYLVWLANRPVRWVAASVESVECENEDTCSVTTSITYRVPGGPTGINQMRMNRDIVEDWIRIDGQWYFVQN
ncbi:hypothetical protein [Wenzhouxiangella marina]|uniref:Uncharacterized protein n=1 Tax=Wenzhouxiangella marina TaxID=1579979 RepID=A0A0K0XT89_9GAMM|nr:hypothetical protein [Wenzhouxiangella marina]AKS40875.1 hypothetical protein WM2015_493 [Wenzhouxiangella marina]MBB6087749.1 hypothetical protein [Wenzhouxiangella marina]